MLSARPKRIFAYGKPVDMLKSFDGLLGVTKQALKEDPLTGDMYVFINRRGNHLKLLYWDRTGYCLFAKRLEKGRFRFPLAAEKQELSEKILRLLLDGIELGRRSEMR